MNSSLSSALRLEQSFSLSGMPAPVSAVLRRIALRAFLAATRACAADCAFLTTLLASVGFSSSHSASRSLVTLLHERAHRDVAELGLRLALELRVAELHRDDRRDALADVLAEEVLVLLLEQALGPGVLVDDRRQRRAEPLDVHPALGRGDAVGVAVDALVVAGVPLDGDVERLVRPRPRPRSGRPWRTAPPSTR